METQRIYDEIEKLEKTQNAIFKRIDEINQKLAEIGIILKGVNGVDGLVRRVKVLEEKPDKTRKDNIKYFFLTAGLVVSITIGVVGIILGG